MSTEALTRKEITRERLGKVLDGRFRLEVFLGSGGTGAVYRARVLSPDREVAGLPNTVAVKILHPHLVSNSSLRELFLKESRISSLVAHPGAVRIFDAAVSADGCAYLVLELLDGRSLQDGLVGWGDLLLDEVVRVSRGVLEVLAAAHDRGVVHCDVKPENVFVAKGGDVKLLDFGVARVTGEARRTGIAGTLAFMAPEQARGEWTSVDARSDVWSVGATFFTLITGQHLPMSDHDSIAPELPASVPAPIADVVRRALSVAREDRWPSARAMLDALTIAAKESGIPRSSRTLPAADEDGDDAFTLVVPPYEFSLETLASSRPPPPPRRRSRVMVAAMLIAAAGILGAGLALAVTKRDLAGHTRARIAKPLSSTTATTAGEVR